ncbi:fibronectin type III domain-containing protein [Paenibacillus sp. S-38]|uniref:fibronectin type III domain-containing protein n=1 Tax=Paenibacillus sp. S-38 TaxID=3416710 RepID=UPI003CE7F4EE
MRRTVFGWWIGLLVLLLVPMYAHGAGEMTLKLNDFDRGEPQYEQIYVSVTIKSEYELQKVTAKIDDKEIELPFRECRDYYDYACYWGNYFPLTGLKQGTKTLTVTAQDYLGNAKSVSKAFLYDAPPEVTVSGVTPNTLVHNGKFRAEVQTSDVLSTPKIVAAISLGSQTIETFKASGALSREVDLSAYKNQVLTYRVEVYDGNHYRRFISTYLLYVDPVTRIPVYDVKGRIVDADGSRVLYVSPEGSLRIKQLRDGSESVVYKTASDPENFYVSDMHLTRTGAILSIGQDYGSIHVWHDGQLIDTGVQTTPGDRGTPTYYLTVQEDGRYAYMHPRNILIDTETGAVTPYSEELVPLLKKEHGSLHENNGWKAVTQSTASGRNQIFLESPHGTVTQVTYFNGYSSILELTPFGGLGLIYNQDFYTYAPGDTLPKKITPYSYYDMSFYYADGSWYQSVSGGLFRLNTGMVPPGDYTPPRWSEPSKALAVTDVTYQGLNLSWQPAVDDQAVTEYRVYREGAQLVTVSGSTYSYAVTGLSPATSYTFRIEALDAAGNRSPVRPSVTAVTLDVPAGDGKAPVWPTNAALSVTDITYSSAGLAWTPAVDDLGVASYSIYANGELLQTVSGEVYAYAVTGLKPETNYTFRVTAQDAAGNVTAQGIEASAVTPAYTPAPVPAPLSLTAKPGFLDVGSSLELKIRAEDAEDLYAFLLKLNYDGARFKLTQVWLDSSFGTEKQDALLSQKTADGSAALAGTLLGGRAGHDGDVGLVTLRFTVLQRGSGEFVLEGGASQLADSSGTVRPLGDPVRLTVTAGGADYDGDGKIGLGDLVLIARHEGLRSGEAGFDARYDLNRDGVVDRTDVQYVADKAAAAG